MLFYLLILIESNILIKIRENKMNKITAKEFMEMVERQNGSEFVGIDLITDPTDEMRKKDNPYLGSTKHFSLTGILGYDYEKSVNNQLEREGKISNFEAAERKWGTRLNRYFVEHKGQFYLTVKVQNSSDPIYVKGSKKFDSEEVTPFLYAKKEALRQVEAGVDSPVIHRDIKIASIKSIRMRNGEYEIISNGLPDFEG